MGQLGTQSVRGDVDKTDTIITSTGLKGANLKPMQMNKETREDGVMGKAPMPYPRYPQPWVTLMSHQSIHSMFYQRGLSNFTFCLTINSLTTQILS